MTEAVNVLLVETDELELHERVEQLLMDGYAVDAVAITEQARVRLADGPDALILCGEPQTIGLLRELRAGEIPRADSTTWVLVVGADDDSAAVRYYRAGADVALPSESSPLLVAAGLEALVRRTGPPQTRIIRVGSLTVDRDARTAHVDGRAVKLTRLEFDLLATLARDPRRTFTRAELTREVWTYDPHATGPSRTVHSHVHRLRHKLEQAGRPGNGADGARGRMEAHPMTDTQPAVAGALGRACRACVCEPHAVSGQAVVPIVAAAIPRQTDIATSTPWLIGATRLSRHRPRRDGRPPSAAERQSARLLRIGFKPGKQRGARSSVARPAA